MEAPTTLRGFPVGRGRCALIINRKKIGPEGSGGEKVFRATTDKSTHSLS